MTKGNPSCPECGSVSSPHLCEPKAQRVVDIFEKILVHTKGRFARSPFILAPWQRDEIIVPLFGTQQFSTELERWVRQYRIAWIEVARKNGKSELLAGFALILLCADDEEGGEVYGCAKDRDQARKVFDVAERMVLLSPTLSKRLEVKSHEKRIIDPKTGSYYLAVAADAKGNLGHNPHGVVFDEVLTQPNGDLWDAMRTGMGTREQPLMIAATTAGNDDSSFGYLEHDYCLKVSEEPARDPARFVFMRNTPRAADPFVEDNWFHANPGLGDFKSVQSLRDEALEARNEPAKENSFRQFQLNQWVQQATRWMPLHTWDASSGEIAASPEWLAPKMAGKRCYAGLDLAAKLDLTAWCLVFPDEANESVDVMWRCWVPEAVVPFLNDHTGERFGIWARDGWVTVTEGDVVDYDRVYSDIAADHDRFSIADVSYDPWSGDAPVQEIQKRTGLEFFPVNQTFDGLSEGMNELMRLSRAAKCLHHGNPVARWNADAVEVKSPPDNPDLVKPVKPNRQHSAKRIDLIVAESMAIAGWRERGARRRHYAAAGF